MDELTIEDYAKGVAKLVELAGCDTGGSRVAAQVLLSTYNGDAFQLNLVDLCNLDHNYFAAAMNVIVGRREFSTEPQTLIQDGGKIFGNLWKQWERLHVDYRGLPSSYLCSGKGRVYVDPEDEDNFEENECAACGGRGWVKPE